MQAGFRQGLDQADLVRRGDWAGLDLKAFARAFLMDFDVAGQVGHGLVSSLCGKRTAMGWDVIPRLA